MQKARIFDALSARSSSERNLPRLGPGLAGLALAWLVAAGCVVDDGGGTEGGTDGAVCNGGCSAPLERGSCICPAGTNDIGCYSTVTCNGFCNAQEGLPGSFTPAVCANAPDSGSCTGWNPTSAVRLVSGVRRIDDVWLASLVSNPAPLWSCDDAVLNDIVGGKFKVLQANAGELLYQLGLRNNDIPQTLNTKPLNSVQDGFDAFVTLYQGGVTNYTLKVKRGTSTLTFLYLID